MIYVDQAFDLNVTFTANGSPVDITSSTIGFDYWLPGNATDIEDGTITGNIVSGPAGTAEAEFPASLNTEPGEVRVQATATSAGKEYPAETTCFTVYPRGARCS